jgi:hypothetical protein
MSYGDTPKSKAHMKRALYYGFGNDDLSLLSSLRTEIENTENADADTITELLVRTFRCIYSTMVTSDRKDKGKIQAVQALKDTTVDNLSEKLEKVKEIKSHHDVGVVTKDGTKDMHVTHPTRFYAVNGGKLTNGSIGPNLTDSLNRLDMRSAFCKTEDDTRDLHTAVLTAVNEYEATKAVLKSIHEKAHAAVNALRDGYGNPDQLRAAKVLSMFWGVAYHTYDLQESSRSQIRVEPLAHANPSGLGVAVFQLMVVFDEHMLRLIASDVMKVWNHDNKLITWPEDSASNTKAWMGMLILLLDGVEGAKKDKEGKVGTYYTLKWGEDSKRTRLDFGRKYR